LAPIRGSCESIVTARLAAIRDITGHIYKLALLLTKGTLFRRGLFLQGITAFFTFPFAHPFDLLFFKLVHFAHNWNVGILEYWKNGSIRNSECGRGNCES
jgi:hypothetical protein